MAADDLLYKEEGDVAIPVRTNVRKVIVGEGLVVGSIGLSGITPLDSTGFAYDFESWINPILTTDSAVRDPWGAARAIAARARLDFEPIAESLQSGGFPRHRPGDKVVTYLLAGYAPGDDEPCCIEIAVTVNTGRTGLNDGEPTPCPTPPAVNGVWLTWLGEAEHHTRARQDLEPEATEFATKQRRIGKNIGARVPGIPASLGEIASHLAALIKVEAKHNPKRVGTKAFISAIEHGTGHVFSGVC